MGGQRFRPCMSCEHQAEAPGIAVAGAVGADAVGCTAPLREQQNGHSEHRDDACQASQRSNAVIGGGAYPVGMLSSRGAPRQRPRRSADIGGRRHGCAGGHRAVRTGRCRGSPPEQTTWEGCDPARWRPKAGVAWIRSRSSAGSAVPSAMTSTCLSFPDQLVTGSEIVPLA